MLEHTEKMTPYRTSMKIDFDEHRPMEVEAIFGNPLRAAQAAGAKSPLLETLYRQLQFLNSANA
jgi:2-dehydropantoate 2-reductase